MLTSCPRLVAGDIGAGTSWSGGRLTNPQRSRRRRPRSSRPPPLRRGRDLANPFAPRLCVLPARARRSRIDSDCSRSTRSDSRGSATRARSKRLRPTMNPLAPAVQAVSIWRSRTSASAPPPSSTQGTSDPQASFELHARRPCSLGTAASGDQAPARRVLPPCAPRAPRISPRRAPRPSRR